MSYTGKAPNFDRLKLNGQSSDPANPREGDFQYADGTVRKEGLWVYEDAAWRLVAGRSSANFNYIEDASTTGWSTYDDGASATPVDGTGGASSTLTLSKNTTSPLRGDYDIKLAKSAADGQGEGISYDFTVDRADKYATFVISFDYRVTANYADDDMIIGVYDKDGAALVTVSRPEIKDNANEGNYTATFVGTGNDDYRVILHVASTNATAYDIHLSNVFVGTTQESRFESNEIVACRYGGVSGTALTDATPTDIPFTTKFYDTHDAYNTSTGVFTFPIAGKYVVYFKILTASVAWTANDQITLQTIHNGTQDGANYFEKEASNTWNSQTCHIFDIIEAATGDTVKLNITITRGADTSLDTNNTRSTMMIAKVG
jgi:hypothetical protein